MKPPTKPGGKSKPAPPAKRRVDTQPQNPTPIVGIGASAGGLEAFRALLETLPATTGMAYVLVQHLDPHHESILAELLARSTRIPVIEAKQRTLIKPDHVYVIPPGKNIALDGVALTLSPRSRESGAINMPIDHFFRSLASAREEKAIGVVLSGTASDGTIGLRAIKEAGGLTFVQNSTAKYQGMPQAAISAGVADYVLPPHKIAQELVALTKQPLMSSRKSGLVESTFTQGSEYQRIVDALHRATGVDFSHYKASTLTRRINRRLLVSKMATPGEYLKFLRGNSNEAEALFNDILINVTGFFRDPAAQHCLVNKVFPQLVKVKPAKEPIRIWVAGCATGEEVYSLAMSLLEFLGDKASSVPLQIFGTDLSFAAIEKARRGVYTRSEVSGISARRLERFFLKANGSYQIRKNVRDICVFSIHNLLKDPPFSRMDIVSCCNVLIYMDAILQRRIFSAFHYALAPHGVLILGKSETTGASPGLFTQIEKKAKVYVKKASAKKGMPPVMPRHDKGVERLPAQKKEAGAAQKEIDFQGEADAIILKRFVPASVVINADLEILQLRGNTEEYLKLPSGKATLHLLKMVREEMVFELRDAILKAKRSGAPVKKESVHLTRARPHTVSIEVIPLRKMSGDAHFLVIFQADPSSESALSALHTHAGNRHTEADNRRVEQLERELMHARDNARSLVEEQEAAVEELQSANEEVLSSNEELQSINEELETSSEELESTNEELNTVNQELQTRNEELTEARDYAESIIATMRTPLLILDDELRVRTANQSFCTAFRTTREETEGHFFYDLGNGQWDTPELRTLLNDVLPQKNVVHDYEISGVFPHIGHRTYQLNSHILDQKGARKLILLAFEDVTEEQEINRQKDEFIGIASHEIKTPITTIKTFTELLAKKLPDGIKQEYANILEHITMQSDRLTTLITDLLSFSQMQAGKFILHKESFDLDKLVERSVRALQESTKQHTIVKEGALRKQVLADASRIEQVLINLLTNAVKYSPNGKMIVVRVEELAGDAVVSVQDFGEGIPKKDHAMIFERFYRGHETELLERGGQSKGFGLGLYISAEIIEKHEGRIWVESVPGKGSTFYFTLPLQETSGRKRASRS